MMFCKIVLYINNNYHVLQKADDVVRK